jgi:LacI family transcriptional regulator
MGITQREMADRLGLSQRAVSMALQLDERLSPSTIQRVWELAKASGYRPNMAAKVMRTGRFNNITVVLSARHENSRLTMPFVNALLGELENHGMHLSIVRVPDARLTRPDSLPRLLFELAADGLIINYLEHVPDALVSLVEQSAQPAVWVGVRLKKDCVYPDAYLAGKLATEHLIELGHRRISYFHPISEKDLGHTHYANADRLAAYVDVMSAHGLQPDHWEKLTQWRSILDSARLLVNRPDPPTAVICSWQSVLPSLLYATAQRGLSIPEDLSIVVLSDPDLDAPMPMTRVEFDFDRRAKVAVDMLMHKIDASSASPADSAAIPPRFVKGRSTAEPGRPEASA